MKRLSRSIAAAFASLLTVSGASGGDLQPPMGPIEPTMLSLDKIEPRRCIEDLPGSAGAVHVITEPGRYFMTRDIVVPPGKNGIVIALPQGTGGSVAIDLGGTTIVGEVGSQAGIVAIGLCCDPQDYCLVAGKIMGMGGAGIHISGAGQLELEDLTIVGCAGDGVHVESTTLAEVSCDVRDCAGDGMKFIQCSTVSYGAKAGKTGIANRVAGCGGNGILVLQCDEVSLHADVYQCGLDGVRVEDAARCDLGVSVVGAGGNGITALRVPDLTCGVVIKTKGTGADKDRVANTGGHGIHAVDCGTVTVVGMSATSCTGDGLHISGASTVFVSDWRDDDCDDDGIEIAAGSVSPPLVHVRDAFSNSAGGNGMRITCSIGRVELSRCTGAALHGMDIDCDSMELSECTSSNNAQRGLTARVRKGMQDIKSYYNDNGWQGSMLLPALGSVQEKAKQVKCSARGNGFSLPGGGAGFEFSGISSVSMHECDSSGNAGSGVVIGDLDRDGRLDLVTCSSNGLHGVHVPGPTSGLPGGRFTATGILCDGNSMDGMRVEGTTGGQLSECVFSSNGGMGLVVFGSSHVIRSNSCTSNGGGPLFVTTPGNVVGPMVDELSVAGNCNPAANYVH